MTQSRRDEFSRLPVAVVRRLASWQILSTRGYGVEIGSSTNPMAYKPSGLACRVGRVDDEDSGESRAGTDAKNHSTTQPNPNPLCPLSPLCPSPITDQR